MADQPPVESRERDLFPFDAEAAGYDDSFSSSVIGLHMRRAVWQRLETCFSPGERVLELGCGTGEDALHLARCGLEVLAVDRSARMVEVARRKLAAAGLADRVELRQMAIEDFAKAGAVEPPIDGAFSNFGALNCVADLAPVAESLAACLRPGAKAVLCLMGPWVPWEWLWFLLRGHPRTAVRRLRPGGVIWRGIAVHYPSIGSLKRTFQPSFELRRVAAVGALVPPSYAEPWAAKRPQRIAWLDRWERRFETRAPLPWLADHYLAELERK